MKKALRSLLLFALMTGCFCVSALAAERTAGIYGVKIESGYESLISLQVQKADGTEITAATETVNGTSVSGFYPQGVRLRVTYSGAEASAQYLILVLSDDTGIPTDGNVAYIDQAGAGENGITLPIYPAELSADKTYSVYLSSSALTGITSLTKVASFQYYVPYNVPYILGDVDEDGNPNGRPTANDAFLTLQASVGKQTLNENQQLASDANRDGNPNGRPTAADALLILQASVGKAEL